MCRRRFFKSYFYINYGGTAHGEAVTVSPFVAAGGSDTIELVSARPWAITNNLSWLSVSSLSNKSGTYTLTLTASENQDQNERSGAFTAKTLDDRHSIVVSVSQQPKTSNYFIYITPQQITLDAEASYDALQCSLYKDDWTFVDVVTPTWSVESEVITVDANGVVRSNNQTPEPVNGIEVSASYIYDGEELWDSMKVNVRAANIQRYITVSPKSSSVGPTGSTNLTVTYHEIINEQHTQTDVTHSNNTVYSVDNPVFTVNDGTVTANNTGETDETATISITYPQTSGTTATITSSTAVIIEWVELGPDEFSLNYNDRETLEVVYVKSVNGVETRTEITDSTLLDFDLSDTYAAKMNNMDLVNINVSNSDKPVDVYVVYNGISSNTIAATMLKPASLTYRLDVTADDNSVKYDGTTQMRAIYVTVINGADYYSEEINPSNVTWSDDSGYASVSSNGVFQANNDSSATTRTATVTGTYNGVSGTKVIAMDKKPGIDVYTPQDYNVSSAAGNCVYTVKWVNLKPGTVIELDSLNLDGYQPTSINITSNNYADDYEVIDATYLENQDPDERRLYLYATGVGLYDENVDDDDFYVQAGNTYTPVVTYLLEVLPDTSATLDYGETTGFTVMYYVITDGQPDGGTDVTTLATYTNTGNNSTAITVSDGDVENVNTGVSTEVVTFSVSYGQADDVDVEITANPAVRDKVLIVTPNPETIDSDGTSQMLAEYQEWIGEDMVVQTQLDPSVVTWSITNGNEYATIDASGEVHGTNETYKAQVVTVRGYYGEKDVEDTANITVRAASVEPYLLIENETEHTDARSDTAGGNLSYTIQFDGIEESSLAISGYDGNISVASINVNKDTLSVSLDANTALTQVSSDLYITATTVYGDTISAHLIITQPEPAPEPQIGIFVTNPVTSNAGGKCDRLTISWTGLTVLPNTGSSRAIRITATWEEDSDITDYQEWQQYGGYVPAYHVWIEDSTTSAEFHNLSLSSITVENFVVYIDGNVDFTTTGTVPSQSVSSLYGDLTGNTGTSSYQLTVSWSGDSHNNNTTTISWIETVNGVSTKREYTLESMETTTDTYYITGDTELSDFVITMDSEVPEPEFSGITYYNPSSIIWGTWGSDELSVTVDFQNVDSFVVDWDDTELDIESFRILEGGTKTGGTGPSYIVYPGETVVPTRPSGTLVLYTDVGIIVSGASALSNTGNINITSYSNNGQVVDTKSIACDS